MEPTRTLVQRETETGSGIVTSNSAVNELLDLLSDPFQSQLESDSFLAALGVSLGVTILFGILFCVLRPYNNVVYAPRSKHADAKHAPPPIGRGPFAWLRPVIKTKEQQLVEVIGMDATLFIRFTQMCRNIFLVLTVIGCGILLPVNLIAGNAETKNFSSVSLFSRLTPQYLFESPAFWAYVVVAYLFDVVICYFLWHNYRAVTRLRRAYFDSPEYQQSLHARTLLITDIPKASRTDEGIVKISEQAKDVGETPRAAVARNVKDLPELVEEHDHAVRHLESVLAKYLRNPNRLPAKRPTCKVSKKDKSHRKGETVDAIDYLSGRIKELEIEVKEVRESVDKRNAMSYGFASYESIIDAHTVAYAARKKAPQHTIMRLAPKPHDLIWKNLPMSKKQRNWNNFINNIWVAILTVVWIVPNVFLSVFLSNLSNLGQLWHGFEEQLEAHPVLWAIIQGVVSPAVSSLFYWVLPIIFRRLSINAGDATKTTRERHVMHKLYSFFVFNNLFVFSLFGAIWKFVVAVIASSAHESIWDALKQNNIFSTAITALISVSTYWISWLLQRNLGAAVDLAQIFRLAWGSMSRRFGSPTPRELIELTAPQPFDYAGYYNYFLFYATVAVTFGCLQPLVLPVTALYFGIDSFSKKYLLLYVFITKTESGGQFWRVLFNRFIFLALFGNVIVALLVSALGDSWVMLGALGPLPFLMLGFKWYCASTFDNQCKYYQKGPGIMDAENGSLPDKTKKGRRSDRVGVRFGHPVLYKPLITPMVHAKSQHLLRSIYSGRIDVDTDTTSVAGYSDIYMDPMSRTTPGKPASGNAPFEIVGENQLDFELYKNRPEFRDELGGDGELYGRPTDLIRRGSGSTFATTTTTTMTDDGLMPKERSRSDSRDSERTHVNEGTGTTYPTGYQKTPTALREHSPADSMRSEDMSNMRGGRTGSDSAHNALLSGAARMGRSPVLPALGGFAPMRLDDTTIYTPGETPGEEDTSYDYFRRGRQT